MKVLIINGSHAYESMFKNLGYELTSIISDADLLCFTGGSDVSPVYYGASKHPQTYNDFRRDAMEASFFDEAVSRKIPMVGICRGGQFLNVMNGGSMYQHVERHTAPHDIVDVHTGETIHVSSTHHQMMKPHENGVLIASSNLSGSREWYEGQVFKKDVSDEDYEVVYYPLTQCLCFQPHPEFEGYPEMREYFKRCLAQYVFNEEVV